MTTDFAIMPGSILPYDKGLGNHTSRYTFVWQGILKVFQAISFHTTGIRINS